MTALKFRAYDGENFWYFTSDIGVFYKHFGGEQSSFDDYMEFSEVVDKGWPVDQWTGLADRHSVDIYCNDIIKDEIGNIYDPIVFDVYWKEYKIEYTNWSGTKAIGQKSQTDRCEIIGNTHEDNK